MTDGTRIEVVANISDVAEAAHAVEAGGEGVGLLRTEFLFLQRDSAPSEDEQFETYAAMTTALNGLPIIIRTLDIGGDKEVPYLQMPAEMNPFLGERGIRLCLARKDLFRTQLRAIFRASATGPVRIMYPMIATFEELQKAKEITEEVRRSLGADPVEIGMMIEVPSSAIMADVFAREVDFFSIGTNDLTQYVLAMDRLHPQLAKQADGLHPAVLRMIERNCARRRSRRQMGRCLRRRRRRSAGRRHPHRPRRAGAQRQHPQHRRRQGADPRSLEGQGARAGRTRARLPNCRRGPGARVSAADARGRSRAMTAAPRIVTVSLNAAIDQTASIPDFTAGEVNRVAWEQSDAGGKGVNVASFLADFGHPVAVTGLLGADNTELFVRLFAEKGLIDRFIRVPGQTRVNVKIVDDVRAPGHRHQFSRRRRGTCRSRCGDRRDRGSGRGRRPSGSSFPAACRRALPPTSYRDLTALLKSRGRKVVLDTSGAGLAQAIDAGPDVIKPNIDELTELVGRPLDGERAVVEAARDLRRRGIDLVAVSMGARGAVFVDGDERGSRRAASVAVKSTVGAGDAMVAGIVHASLQKLALEECARLATAFSVGALGEIGPRLPPRDVIEAYRGRGHDCDSIAA